jgi:hypothetical protein
MASTHQGPHEILIATVSGLALSALTLTWWWYVMR